MLDGSGCQMAVDGGDENVNVKKSEDVGMSYRRPNPFATDMVGVLKSWN